MDNLIDKSLLLEKAKSLVSLLERENATNDEIEVALSEIATAGDSNLFQELGKMTREIHEAIMSFRMDSRIANLANTDFPDAKDRLEYVITMTEKAANTVLTVVEKGTPVAEKLSTQAKHLGEQWGRFRRREMQGDELRAMGSEVEEFFAESETMMSELLSGFTEVLMAQDFQDLTSQIIRKVITLVDDVETNLVELIKIQGEHLTPPPQEEKNKKAADDRANLDGPQIPGKETDEVMTGQDDVDDLLASLGF
ncbi:MAG: protein phosphatase CheZ [Gammaproteobacteria bacterium]|nr:protein phosphatase CheZ [Gammaproteobacteria bacterium]MCW8911672.1 protein phosphatase CheZ [Gammaproteobacteria bacterium]MCW9003930.1 protein phosphatase CheZ [Gammaproteobacteria bacterium]MCW9056926.1 protein phosphatase CheZ [Gammaproteobacteria bacterium]